ncbi:MAG: hypothetical protein A2Z72_05410 [Omnitrophica bacterium RBG_13_46_9]|nr:MAG: hypothetical protein A2Z72_05410 [Omnitrophica bacterium RBG_13_46_9]
MRDHLQILYITYDGVMEPLGRSQVLSYLKKLSGKGIKFYLVSFEKKVNLRDVIGKAKLQTELNKYGIEWKVLRYHKHFRVLATMYDVAVGIFGAMAIAKRTRPDIVHARSYVAALMAWAVGSLAKAKFVFDMRGFWADERVDAGLLRKNSPLYKIIKKLENIFVHKADRIVVLTNKAGEELVLGFSGIKKDKIEVIPCCTDTVFFKFDEGSRNVIKSKYGTAGRVVFIHTGSLIGWYMIREMLEYFRAIKALEPKALFMFLSPEADRDEFFKAVDSVRISRYDIILTEADFEGVNRYLSAADAGLFFIKPTFSKRASCPIKLAEYLSCALPVICNRNIGDLDDIIEKNRIGILVDGFNMESYKDSYKRFSELLKDKELKTRCRKVAEELFSVEKGAESYLEVYHSITEC